MSDLGNDIVTLIDEEGNEVMFEHIATLEHNDQTYMAFTPASVNLEEDAELVILKVTDINTEDEALATIDDELELESVFPLFMELLGDDYLFGDEQEDTLEDDEDDEDDE